jgi:uncharacterized membrane protein
MLSPTKIIFIVIALAIAYFGMKFYRTTIKPNLEKGKKNGEFEGRSSDKMLDLQECKSCGAFVADLEDHSCKS